MTNKIRVVRYTPDPKDESWIIGGREGYFESLTMIDLGALDTDLSTSDLRRMIDARPDGPDYWVISKRGEPDRFTLEDNATEVIYPQVFTADNLGVQLALTLEPLHHEGDILILVGPEECDISPF